MVTKLDRLARSSRDLLNILHDLEQGSCGFLSLGETWCDTTSDVGKLVVTIMSGIAEFERKLILSRTEDGIAKARASGKKFGRPSVLCALASMTTLSSRWLEAAGPMTADGLRAAAAPTLS